MVGHRSRRDEGRSSRAVFDSTKQFAHHLMAEPNWADRICEANTSMAQARSQFVGAAGQYFVAYSLAVRGVNASLTLGNAPSVDVLAASPDGRRTLAIQVKTSRNAYRRMRYERQDCHEWDVGAGAIGKWSENFWYAMVDLREGEAGWEPTVFFVPSQWVADFVKPEFSRKMYILPGESLPITKERWDLVEGYLSGDMRAITWATDLPPEARWS